MDKVNANDDVKLILSNVKEAQKNLLGMIASQDLDDRCWCISNLIISLDKINGFAKDLSELINADKKDA